ncbi:hypothetical protein CFO_g4783 [Ceratocystis platani]|uniref:Uncharacterized protein n=1 Tax=Ceratocystis fimbriata f. sp. platani TaxID=88771 RepID=A0A0F8CQ28_CERFI|nr:hypothetical protein CFO_g4783 [Ceratocystis platani]
MDPQSQPYGDGHGQSWAGPALSSAGLSSARTRSRRNDESWVEISSEPSSSLSSVADEIVTTGLRIGSTSNQSACPPHGPNARRRRSAPVIRHPCQDISESSRPSSLRRGTAHDFEASGSEEEAHILASSSETGPLKEHGATAGRGGPVGSAAVVTFSPTPQIAALPMSDHAATESESESESASDFAASDDDENENDTAETGAPSTTPVIFRPQPNAFNSAPVPVPAPAPAGAITRRRPTHPHNTPLLTQRRGSAPASASHFRSPTFRVDNDAALRASLNTLLSCAAAARGFGRDSPVSRGVSTASQDPLLRPSGAPTHPMNLQIVPESELMRESDDEAHLLDGSRALSSAKLAMAPPAASGTSSSSASSRRQSLGNTADASTRTRRQTSATRAHKKRRTPGPTATSPFTSAATTSGADTSLLSPTALTWVVSAGVVVLFSVVGFGAGYVIGREVGRQETLALASAGLKGGDAAACSVEVGSGGLRHFRWGVVV